MQDLRYTVDGSTWKESKSFFTGQKEKVVMGRNFFVCFTAPDNNSTFLLFSFFYQTFFFTTTSPSHETARVITIYSTTVSCLEAAFGNI